MKKEENKPKGKAYEQHRKKMLVLPLLVTPFLTFGFWAMGGGSGDDNVKVADKRIGFNLQLPSAEGKSDSTFDKLAFYQQAEKDSIERLRRMREDPYYQQRDVVNPSTMQYPMPPGSSYSGGAFPTTSYGTGQPGYPNYGYTGDPNERRVQERLAQLQQVLNSPVTPAVAPGQTGAAPGKLENTVSSVELDRLEKMMNSVQTSGEGDAEMQQIQDVLGQLLDIQHPERVSERIREASLKNRGQVYAVSTVRQLDPISYLQPSMPDSARGKSSGFFGLSGQEQPQDQNSIEAVMYETQTIISGSVVKFRLLNDIYVNGQMIPKDCFVFGVARLSGERLLVDIKSIRYRNNLYPITLSVVDIDGLDGIHIPGAISRDVAKESGDRAIQSLGMTTLDPSMTAQALNVGVEAAKSLMSKKVKLVKVTVKGGYKVLLRDQQQKNNQ